MSTDNQRKSTRDINGSDWLQTIDGKAFFVLDPRPGDFTIEVIAHALACQCRFNGHMLRFYSVAEHSVLVSHILRDRGESLLVQACGLMHDAAEAYIGDLIRPVKAVVPEYRRIEHRIESMLAAQYGLPFPWPPEVKMADNMALAVEKRDLLRPGPRPWADLPAIPPDVSWQCRSVDWETARDLFLARFTDLAGALGHEMLAQAGVP